MSLRPRTSSTSLRLPLYERSSPSTRYREREWDRQRDPPRLRNRDGSPKKTHGHPYSYAPSMTPYQSLRYGQNPLNGLIRSPRNLRQLLVVLALLGFACVTLFLWVIEPHIELAFYSRDWVAKEILPTPPLAGCFNPSRVSPFYNMTVARGPKRTVVQAGLPMQLGLDCYDFAGTIQPPSSQLPTPSEDFERTNYHTYWRTDLNPFSARQEWLVKSFFATQDISRSRLILWSNGDLSANEYIQKWRQRYPEAFETRIVDMEELAKGTALESSELLHVKDRKAWVDGDLIRLLVIWAYGGVWVDMDSLMTRDLSPLLEHEFVTQWDCYDKIYQPMNGAIMHFYRHSPYLCEAFSIMSNSPPPKSGSTDWGSLLYHKLWRRLIASSIPPFQVLPFCFTDGRSCRLDNRLPDPFASDKEKWGGVKGGMREGGKLDEVLGKVFSVHLHNQWEKRYPEGGWVERLLLRRYNRKLGVEEGIEERVQSETAYVVRKDHS